MTCKKKWYVYAKKADFAGIASRFGIDPVTARILRNRDIVTDDGIRSFLYGGLKDLYSPELLPDAAGAAECLCEKIREGKKIRIVGDYDIDGVCATYILYDGLKSAGAVIDYRIPERIRDGYGINDRIVGEAIRDGVDTLLTCDNGISAFDEMKTACDNGMTVILTDHHDIRRDEEGNEQLPPADYLINAKLERSRYPEKEICGAVTAWKLLQLVYRFLGIPESRWESYLEFAGIATIGDVMKLVGENRIIAREALRHINNAPVNPGLAALIDETGLCGKHIGCYHIGFVLGPCINAGGRLETAEAAMELFLAAEPDLCGRKAKELKELNDSRKDLTLKGTKDAVSLVSSGYPEDRILVVCLPELHESMAGIVAGRLKEEFGRPAFVFTGSAAEPGLLKGSGRSVEAWNMFGGLQKCSDLLERFGGHPMAAGLSVRKENLENLRKRLNEDCTLTEEDMIQKIWIDMQLPLSYLRKDLVREIEELEPFGNGNAKPLFAEKNVKLTNLKVIGKSRNVLKMEVYSETGTRLPGLMFGEADRLKEELEGKGRVHIIFHPQINDYQGFEQLQLQIEDFTEVV